MFLHSLSVINFKNYSSAEVILHPSVNAFVGNNGEGKTNLLDAIYFLSLCKSYFNATDSAAIRHGEEFFVLQGVFHFDDRKEAISCGIKKGQRKVFKRNQREYEKLSDHIGLIPLVMVSPTDIGLITDGSEERRKFMDGILSQLDHAYLDELIHYNKVLMQRNAYLKQAAMHRNFDALTLQIWDDQLILSGEKVYQKRAQFINAFIPVFEYFYGLIVDKKERVSIGYSSQLNDTSFSLLLEQSLSKDRIVQYTTHGPHKDDLTFLIGDHSVKKYASQGQQKSFLIALKLAQFEFFRKEKGLKPILLLDDIFDKLDDTRVARLMEMVSNDNFGQIFITDTHPERIQRIFDEIGVEIKCFPVENGEVRLTEDQRMNVEE